jgi:hypothetical protein
MTRPSNQLVQLLWNGEYQQIITLVNKTLQSGNETSVQLAIAGVALHHQGLKTQSMEAFLLAGQKNHHVNLVAKDLFGLEELLYLSNPSFVLPNQFLEDNEKRFSKRQYQSLPGQGLFSYLIELIEIATFCCLQTQPRLAITYYQQYEIEKSALEFSKDNNHLLAQLSELEELFNFCFTNSFSTPVEYVVALVTMKELLNCIDEDDKISIRCSLQQAKTDEPKLTYRVLDSIPLIEQTLGFLFHLPEIDKQAMVYLLGYQELLSLSDLERMNKAYRFI